MEGRVRSPTRVASAAGRRHPAEHAAVGEALELELLESLDPGDHLAELFRCHLLASHSEGQRVSVTTAHPLYGEMVRAELSSRRLRAVTATLAARLTGTGLRRRSDALRAARWQLDGGRTVEPEVMVRGAAEALNGFDFALADRMANAGLAHGVVDRGETLYLVGCSLSHQGRVEEAFFGSVTLYQAVRLGAADRVADLLARSASHVGHRLVPTMADHASAMVEGDADGADAAAERFQTMDLRLGASEAYAQAAELHARGRQGVAAHRSATRSRLLQRHCPGADTPALRKRPATLSDRQIGVAVLAVGPLTSRAIAERLYLSRRTVDNHLGSIYRKLGLHGRDELQDLLSAALPGGSSLI